ncbi:uncharacterized protein BDV14DRAFT_194883 [Aspergillus stella-maris]|uniref:uncharacterized protein n=1 Tax=Aspergillus stella-maris TaxID=1810926 RepID=UPI003CCE3895
MADLDEFAQTRGADDLFDDEIIPVSAEEQTTVVEVEPSIQAPPPPEPAQAPVQTAAVTESLSKLQVDETPARETETTPIPDAPRSRGGEKRGRGRGRGGRGHGRGARDSGSRRSDDARSKPDEVATETETRDGEEIAGEVATNKNEEVAQDDAAADVPRVPAVRGDRSATGGVKKPKLTEEELSQRIALARENAAKKAAAHARAEADQASFEEREKVAEKKRREERANRRVMDNEREKNRLRKLEALNGREWDAEKPEDQFKERGGQYRRGMHGGVSGVARQPKGLQDSRWADASPSPDRDDDSSAYEQGHGPGRGRGRGRGGRGGRGRGGHRRDASREQPSDAPSQEKPAPTPIISNEAEFPSLPGGERKEKDTTAPAPAPAINKEPLPSLDDATKAFSPISGATWADQVEAGRD